jgi:alkylation response protein AidB-like acyl-CoA dehydrogenase
VDFGLSEEQQMLQDTIRGFIEQESPIARVRELYDLDSAWDAGVWKGLVEMGLTGLQTPEEHGGVGLEALELALVSEVMGEAALPGPFLPHSLASLAIALGGSDEQKAKWLPQLAAGDVIATLAVAESGSAWDPEEWKTAVKGGGLHGEKQLVPDARVAQLVVVTTKDGGLAVVEREAPGVALEAFDSLDRTRRFDTLHFDGAACELLPNGAAAWPRVRDAGLITLSADAFGAANALIQATVDYLTTREQFGTPLVQFQGIKHQLANLVLVLEPARALYWYAAHAFDHAPDEAERAAAMAKQHITDRAMDVARECVELFGGIGFTWECDVHLWYKRIVFDRNWLGGPDLHRERAADLAGW